jgi:hypothetical protein
MAADRDEPRSLLQRIRWGNIARVCAVLATIAMALAWTRGGSQPKLPPDPSPQPAIPRQPSTVPQATIRTVPPDTPIGRVARGRTAHAARRVRVGGNRFSDRTRPQQRSASVRRAEREPRKRVRRVAQSAKPAPPAPPPVSPPAAPAPAPTPAPQPRRASEFAFE